MSNEEIARCYRVLKIVLRSWEGSLVDAEVIIGLMESLEEELT
jgi:hypothetical protein